MQSLYPFTLTLIHDLGLRRHNTLQVRLARQEGSELGHYTIYLSMLEKLLPVFRPNQTFCPFELTN